MLRFYPIRVALYFVVFAQAFNGFSYRPNQNLRIPESICLHRRRDGHCITRVFDLH